MRYTMTVTVTANDTMICEFTRGGSVVERLAVPNVSTSRDFNVRAAYATRGSRTGAVTCFQNGIDVLRPFAI